MDTNSLSHTTWNCKYHIVFAPKFRRKIIYGQLKQDIANILSALCKKKRREDSRIRSMSGPYPYVSGDSAQYKCFKFCGIFEREKHINDIRETRKFEIQIWEPTFLV